MPHRKPKISPTDVGHYSSESEPDSDIEPVVEAEPTDPLFHVKSFLRGYNGYDLMPDSGKVVILDSRLSFLDVVYAMGENQITSAPVWHSQTLSFAAIITITDILRVAVNVLGDATSVDCGIGWVDLMDSVTIGQEKKLDATTTQMVAVRPSDSLLDGLIALRLHEKHRLPLLSKQGDAVLHVISHRRIIRFIVSKYRRESAILKKSLAELDLGVKEPLTISPDVRLLDACQMLLDNGVSSLPIVDEDGAVLDLFSKSDFLFLLYHKLADPNMCVIQAVSKRSAHEEGLTVLPETASLVDVFTTVAEKRIHRVMCLDENRRIVRLVALCDLLNVFIE